MATKTGARIYRRAPKPLADGACPHCARVVSVNPNGRRRRHRNSEGAECSGSGVAVGEQRAVLLDELPDVVIPPERTTAAASVRRRRPLESGKASCPECGRRMPVNSDGTMRAHRMAADDFTAPYCPEGGDPHRNYTSATRRAAERLQQQTGGNI